MLIAHKGESVMGELVPEGEGNKKPIPVGIPEKLLARLDACAKATGNSRTDVILSLLRHGLTTWEGQQPQKGVKKS